MTPKNELAPQEALQFNQIIIDFFVVKVLGIKEFLITDESFVSDFCLFLDTRGKQTETGQWAFSYRQLNLQKIKKELGEVSIWELPAKDRKKYMESKVQLVDDEDVIKVSSLQEKTTEVFKVKIPKKYLTGSLVELGVEISKRISPQVRKQLEEAYPTLFN